MFLHRFTRAVVAASFLLVVVGGIVGSIGWDSGGAFYQQGHRLVGAIVGLLTTLLAVAFVTTESRAWVKFLTLLALAVIVGQGTLGAFTVFQGLPATLSSTHAGLAQIFFALTVALAVVTSRGWQRGYEGAGAARSTTAFAADARLRHMAVASIIVVYLEVVLGAVVRHTGSAQAIPDYPLSFGRLLPAVDTLASGPIAVSFAHRLVALALVVLIGTTGWRVVTRYRNRQELVTPAVMMLVLVAVEVVLGALAVATDGAVIVSAALVAAGALLLAACVVLALRVHRPFFDTVPQATTTC